MNLDKVSTFCNCQTNCFKLVCFSVSLTFLLEMLVFVWKVTDININPFMKKISIAIFKVDGMTYV